MILNVGCGGRQNDKMSYYGDVRMDLMKYPNVTDIIDVHRMPLEWAERFDKVVCYTALEHFREPGLALEEIYRVLTPMGILEIVIPNVFHFRRIYRNWKKVPEYFNGDPDKLPDHVSAWDLIELRNLVRPIGFSFESFEYLDWLPEQKMENRNRKEAFLERFLPPIFTKTELKVVLKK